MNKKNIKFILSIIYIVLIFISSSKSFLLVDNFVILSTSKMTGFFVILLGAILLMYAASIKNKVAMFISYIVSMVGYLLTFIEAYDTYNLVADAKSNVELGIGCKLYIVAVVLLIIMLFFRTDSKEEVNGSNVPADMSDSLNGINPNSFLLCNMILGFKEIPYNHLILMKKIDDKVSIEYKKDTNIESFVFMISDIKSINYIKKTVLESKNKDINNTEMANMLLSYSLFGSGPAGLAGAGILNVLTDSYDYDKADLKDFFEINISVMFNNELKNIKVMSRKDPSMFINELGIVNSN